MIQSQFGLLEINEMVMINIAIINYSSLGLIKD